jgi:hypothetical protein
MPEIIEVLVRDQLEHMLAENESVTKLKPREMARNLLSNFIAGGPTFGRLMAESRRKSGISNRQLVKVKERLCIPIFDMAHAPTIARHMHKLLPIITTA